MPRRYSVIIFVTKIKSEVILRNNPADTIKVACMCMWVGVCVAVD